MLLATRRFLFASLIVALLAGLACLPGLPGDFVFDDLPNIVNNEAIQLDTLDGKHLYQAIATPQVSGNLRTLPTVTFALDYWRGGGKADPATFKTTNILIHALTALMLAWFFRCLLTLAGLPPARVAWAAPGLALAWALHPLQVSSVLYAVQRLQTLGTLFLVPALTAYLKARQAQMAGQRSRTWWMLAALLWALALSCKEDAVLLPAYMLALELTVLHFRTADAALARRLRKGCALAVLAGAALFFLWAVPHYWSHDGYGGVRNFSTGERLLTEARVLCLYLWQIVLPLPAHMPFYYDWLPPSRGLLQPWTTMTSLLFLAGLLAAAWRLRQRLPLFSLGVLLFFAAHFITANVVGLELAFEHRNSFALIGAVLAIGSLLSALATRLHASPGVRACVASVLLLGLASATLVRAHDWRDRLSFDLAATRNAPHSGRAWVALCADYLKEGGGTVPGNPLLDKAIAACRSGTRLAPDSLNNLALLIVLETLRGNDVRDDWRLYQQRLASVHLNWDNRRTIQMLIYHADKGIRLDGNELLKAFATLDARVRLEPFSLASIGYFVMNNLDQPDLAMPYFLKAIERSHPRDPFPMQLANELREKRRPDLAGQVESLGIRRYNETSADQ